MSENIIRVKDFEGDVIARSSGIPVVVDFWAEWCGPCKVLGPVLERLAAGADGKWVLATLNTEEFPEISARYGVRSIPNVKLFVDGRVADEFTGALPEYAVRQWLDKAVPGPSAKMLSEAKEKLSAGDTAGGERLLKAVMETDPGNAEARVIMARLILMEDPAGALRLVEGMEEPLLSDEIEVVETVARLHRLSADPAPLPEGGVKDLYLRAIRAFLAGDPDAALSSFIEVIRTDRYYDDDGSRKACIAIFRLLGEEHGISLKHRRDFGSALYV